MADNRYSQFQTFDGVQDGIVVQNTNVEGSKEYVPGSVRVRIPTICEPDSSWAVPFGGYSGGGSDRGLFMVPDIGSSVACFFVEGDPDELYYAPSGWSFEKLPQVVKEAFEQDGSEGASLIEVWSNDRFELVFDKRPGKARLYMRSKRHTDEATNPASFMIELDDETGAMALNAPSGITLNSLGRIVINGSSVEILGRSVNPMGDTI